VRSLSPLKPKYAVNASIKDKKVTKGGEMSGYLTNVVKEKRCLGCRQIFGAKKKSGRYGGYQDYCERCVKNREYFNKSNYISDEGVVIK